MTAEIYEGDLCHELRSVAGFVVSQGWKCHAVRSASVCSVKKYEVSWKCHRSRNVAEVSKRTECQRVRSDTGLATSHNSKGQRVRSVTGLAVSKRTKCHRASSGTVLEVPRDSTDKASRPRIDSPRSEFRNV